MDEQKCLYLKNKRAWWHQQIVKRTNFDFNVGFTLPYRQMVMSSQKRHLRPGWRHNSLTLNNLKSVTFLSVQSLNLKASCSVLFSWTFSPWSPVEPQKPAETDKQSLSSITPQNLCLSAVKVCSCDCTDVCVCVCVCVCRLTCIACIEQMAMFKKTRYILPCHQRPASHTQGDQWLANHSLDVYGAISGPFTAWTRAISHRMTEWTVLREQIIWSRFQYYSVRREELWPWRRNTAKSSDSREIQAFCLTQSLCYWA